MLHECDNCHTRREIDGIRRRGTYIYCLTCDYKEWHWPIEGAIRTRIDTCKPNIPPTVHQWAAAKRT